MMLFIYEFAKLKKFIKIGFLYIILKFQFLIIL